jgi:hypothetical protein
MRLKLSILAFALGLFNILNGQVALSTNIPSNLQPGSNTEVEIRVNKGSIINFAKYQLDVPAGVTVSEVDSKAGNFTFENNRAKIVWVSVPSEAEFSLKFKIAVSSSAPSEGAFIQKFYFLDNGAKKEVEAAPITIAFGGSASSKNLAGSTTQANNNTKTTNTNTQPVASTPAKTEPVKSEPAKTEPVKTQPVKTEPVKTQPVASTPTKTEPVKTEPAKVETPASTGGLIYRVQLASAPTDPGKSRYSALGKVDISKEDGAYKVLYGTYNSKEEALKGFDEAAAKGFKGFIVKYQNGVRVK